MKQDHLEIAHANMACGAYFAKTLSILGLKKIFFSPGSRSTPLILGVKRYSKIELIPVLDERTAGFLALGQSMNGHCPIGLICTSGSALTHWFPAITEASHSGIPLLLFSADRPPELQDCGAGQTIDQKNLFGNFVRNFQQIEIPQANLKFKNHLISSLKYAYQRSLGINPGPVHLNFPFREPFLTDSPASHSYDISSSDFHFDKPIYPDSPNLINHQISHFLRPLIISGQYVGKDHLNAWLEKAAVPIICDSLCSLRQSNASNLILKYENILRDPAFSKEIKPDLILTLGRLPTSKTLRQWIENTSARRIIIEPRGVNVDPLKGESTSFQIGFDQLHQINLRDPEIGWLDLWLSAEKTVDIKLEKAFSEEMACFEGKLAYLLSIHLPHQSNLFVSNSMPIRDIEWFWKKSSSERQLFGNRGVNGIDGTLGTAIGMSHGTNVPCYLLTGDLAFLHDSNALLFAKQFRGRLTIFVINNNGGGIFEHLPIAKEPEFEEYFATPQQFDLSNLCTAFEIQHSLLSSWNEIIEKIKYPHETGIEVIEIHTDRRKDRLLRQKLLSLSPSPNA